MNFIEQVFGLAPDGGSGLLELMLVLAPIVGMIALYIARHRIDPSR